MAGMHPGRNRSCPFTGDPAGFRGLAPGDPEIVSFLDEVNAAMPGEPIVAGHALRVHSGLLPALPPGRDGRVRLRRKSEIRVDAAGGGAPLLTASTVKFTAARRVAEDAVDRLAKCLDLRLPSSSTASTPLRSAPGEGMESLARAVHEELTDVLAPDEIDHMVRTHGTRWREVVAWRDVDPTWSDRPSADVPVLRAQLLHGAHHELAATPEDLVHRHIEEGVRVPGGDALLSEARAILGSS
jgi:glycerol-3-phosphate dehydrogenase